MHVSQEASVLHLDRLRSNYDLLGLRFNVFARSRLPPKPPRVLQQCRVLAPAPGSLPAPFLTRTLDPTPLRNPLLPDAKASVPTFGSMTTSCRWACPATISRVNCTFNLTRSSHTQSLDQLLQDLRFPWTWKQLRAWSMTVHSRWCWMPDPLSMNCIPNLRRNSIPYDNTVI